MMLHTGSYSIANIYRLTYIYMFTGMYSRGHIDQKIKKNKQT